MGKAIEEIALERGHTISIKANSDSMAQLSKEELQDCDVAIEFSVPFAAINNIRKCIQANLPIVVGTTGWYDHYEAISTEIKESKSALLTATNFSVGVNLFFELNRKLAQLMAPREEYNASIEEIHHLQKLDSPSGTAITLAEGLIENHPSYQKWINDANAQESELPIISKREEGVPGTHSIQYSSEIDDIEITHTAKSRKGFALGAVLAAEFLKDKHGLYTMKDVLKI